MKFFRAHIAISMVFLTMMLCLGVTAARAQEGDDTSSPQLKEQTAHTSGCRHLDRHRQRGRWRQRKLQWVSDDMQLTQKEKKIGGTFDITTGDENPAGTLKGIIKTNDLLLTLHAHSGSKRNCTATLTATVTTGVDGDTMSGSWTVSAKKNCKGTGTFNLAKH